MNNFAIVVRMLQIMHNTKSQSIREWAEKEGKKALLTETILNPIK